MMRKKILNLFNLLVVNLFVRLIEPSQKYQKGGRLFSNEDLMEGVKRHCWDYANAL